jgi:shikimate kinase
MTSARAEAVAHGAATIVNAIATGEGAAFGVDLWTRAKVELTNEAGVVKGEIESDPTENTLLIEKAVLRVFERFRVEKQIGAKVKTTSNIPIARGLKSSSVAANAVVLATLTALNKNLDDIEIVNLGVNAAFDAKVTVTGAFDDACASYLGGIVVTDNTNRKLLKRTLPPPELQVLFHVPSTKAYTANADLNRIKAIAPLAKIAHQEAVKSNYWTALSLNGIIYSAALGFDTSATMDALNAGALAAGLCGKGPATAAVVTEEKANQVKDALKNHKGEIIHAKFNVEKASARKTY